ncbi:MAG: dipeptidyl peptidase 3 [Bacteroidia bacterium]|nr:dipeptidyl peptidase 3 [Bacteroidia bacterium]MDW8345503.1 dihydrofolate reductase [Bacteroidia bacterium]
MNWKLIIPVIALALFLFTSCTSKKNKKGTDELNLKFLDEKNFSYRAEQFADLQVLRYKIPGFEQLTPQQKELAYYLYQAALSGRDIIYDQHNKHNLAIRRTLEGIYTTYKGDKNTEDYKKFVVYTKRVWFSNGIHHHYAKYKIMPQFSEAYFEELLKNSDPKALPMPIDEIVKKVKPIIFDPNLEAKGVDLDPNKDVIQASANNFYEGVTQKEVEEFYRSKMTPNDPTPPSYGLNSKLIKENGQLVEKVWKVGGMYSPAIEKIVYWLEKALTVAENEKQKKWLQLLIEYYKTGDLKKFDEYNIAWVQDTESRLDAVNGFIEVYGDALGYKGSFESVVSFRDMEATKRIAAISKEAQYFEDNSPIMPQHKKKNVVGITAKVITVITESGDASPSTPIGINLPNADWIRKNHGSKSVNLGNIVDAYNLSSAGSGFLEEFAYSQEEIELEKKYGALADNLHTDMHEVIGHASGQLNPGKSTDMLKNYASTLEEARADLVALYYLMDQKLIDIGVMPNFDVAKAGYNDYISNGLMRQLVRLKEGEDLEEAHMRNRQLVASWVYEKGKKENVIEKVQKEGKTYFVIRDYQKLRKLFGDLLREIQRIKSEGDYEAGKKLVETYGVKVDKALHKEVLERYRKLNLAPYRGFINPVLIPIEKEGKIVDVQVKYPQNFDEQMLYYAKNYSFLPTYN